jgi:mono/diheme cytochrome c family protein
VIVSRTNLALAVLVLLVFVAAGAVNVDYSRPNYEFLPEMKYSPAYGAFEPNPNFANGRTLQAPVAGTIARGEMPLHYAATKEDALRAGEELNNPYDLHSDDEQALQSAAASVQRGAELFRIYCACCHGATGMGDGPVAQRGFPPPPSLLTGKSMQMQDGQIFHVLTYGQGSMSPFAAQLTPGQRWDLVNHVRSMQQAAVATPPAAQPESESPAP